jgi:hypothetical protein
MKKHFILILVVATVLAMALVAFAQPGGGAAGSRGRGNFQARREAQMKAVEAIEQAVAKLKAGMQPMMTGGQRGNFQDMSEEERASFRERMMQRRQEQQDAVATIEAQVVMLKGRRQLRTEHEDALAQLQAIEAQAKSENATKTAAMIAKMIEDKQTKYDQLMEKLGYGQN